MRYCFVKQDGMKDCGVACLLMIIRTYKGGCSKEYLRNLTHTTKDGTTAYDLMKAGEKFHFTTFGLRGKVENLEEGYFPVIAHVVKEEKYQHFVVIYHYNRRKQELIIADPAIGIRKMALKEFQKISTEQFIILIQNTTILKIHSKHPIRNFLKDFLKQNRKKIGTILLYSFFYSIFCILLTFSFQLFVDFVFSGYSKTTYVTLFFSLLVIILLKCIFQYVRFQHLLHITHRFDASLFENIYHHLFLLPESYYQNRTTGELLARIMDLSSFKNMISKFLLDIVIDSVLASFSLLILFFLNATLTWILLGFVFLHILLFCIFKSPLKRKMSEFKEETAKFQSYLVDTISSLASIRHIGCEKYIESVFAKKHHNELKESFQYQTCWNQNFFWKNLMQSISQLVLIATGCFLIFQEKMSISGFMSYWFLASFFLEPFTNFYSFLLDCQEGMEAFERIEEFYQVEEQSPQSTIDFPSIESLEVRHLTYFYRHKEPVLMDFNSIFLKGEKILIYGKSGSGKSTLMKILTGFIDSYQGSVVVNGQLLSKTEKQFLQKAITYVSQEESLLNMSLRENITMGRQISKEQFSEICRILHIDDFVTKSVLAYDMLIEEDGNNLSGGERQRVILARSILKESDIYILDESLCNMDVTLEREVLTGLFKYLKEKTVIVVSHRFYNQDLYDRSIQLQKGGCYAAN